MADFSLLVKDIKKFWDRTKVTDSCWEWDGNYNSAGKIPTFTVANQKHSARRISYLIHYGRDPETRVKMICGNRNCVSPQHMVVDDKMVAKHFSTKSERKEFTSETARKIILLKKLGRSSVKIAKETGVNQPVVHYVLKMAKYCKDGELGFRRKAAHV